MSDNLLSGLVGAIIGAIIGGFAAAYGQYRYTKKHAEEIEKKTVLNLSKAFYIELSSLWERYMAAAGKEIENTDESKDAPLTGLLETPQSYFTVFDNSSNLLGLFPHEIAEKIIKTYVNAKAFLDELIHYGRLTQRYEEAKLGIEHGTFSEDKFNELRTTHPQILGFFQYLKKRHFEVKELCTATTEMLKKSIDP